MNKQAINVAVMQMPKQMQVNKNLAVIMVVLF